MFGGFSCDWNIAHREEDEDEGKEEDGEGYSE
jgi:hypothetical protein